MNVPIYAYISITVTYAVYIMIIVYMFAWLTNGHWRISWYALPWGRVPLPLPVFTLFVCVAEAWWAFSIHCGIFVGGHHCFNHVGEILLAVGSF